MFRNLIKVKSQRHSALNHFLFVLAFLYLLSYCRTPVHMSMRNRFDLAFSKCSLSIPGKGSFEISFQALQSCQGDWGMGYFKVHDWDCGNTHGTLEQSSMLIAWLRQMKKQVSATQLSVRRAFSVNPVTKKKKKLVRLFVCPCLYLSKETFRVRGFQMAEI